MHGYIHTTKNNSFIANKNKVNEREGKHEKKEKRKIMKKDKKRYDGNHYTYQTVTQIVPMADLSLLVQVKCVVHLPLSL